jgi:hypothetical protein
LGWDENGNIDGEMGMGKGMGKGTLGMEMGIGNGNKLLTMFCTIYFMSQTLYIRVLCKCCGDVYVALKKYLRNVKRKMFK